MHLLVTNDFPPKVGGIQSYLWELWRRLPPEEVTVLTTTPRSVDTDRFDRAQGFRIERINNTVMWPTRALARRIESLARATQASFAVLDPALPAGLVGGQLELPYAVVVHGSELLGRLPVGDRAMGRVIAGARHVIAAGDFPASEARRVARHRTPAITIIPPGIDGSRFRPFDEVERKQARRDFRLPEDAPLVVGVSRLVPRKGFHTFVRALAILNEGRRPHQRISGAIGSDGRERARLARLIERTSAPVQLLGRIPDGELAAFYACADVFCMPCSTRWGGLEPEGFGIVFVEAAACAVPQVAGDSGGATDAVVDGETGIVVRNPRNAHDVAAAIKRLVEDDGLREKLGAAGRQRALTDFNYDTLAIRLWEALSKISPKP